MQKNKRLQLQIQVEQVARNTVGENIYMVLFLSLVYRGRPRGGSSGGSRGKVSIQAHKIQARKYRPNPGRRYIALLELSGTDPNGF
jgi:hypothetical protein